MTNDETQNLINAGEALALACSQLIREFNRNPVQPDLGMTRSSPEVT